MVETTLALAALATYLVATTYAYVGYRMSTQARIGSASGRAMLFFSIWWLSTAMNQFMGSTLYLASAFGHSSLSVQLAYVIVQRLLLALSLVALMQYLVYLQTGRDRTLLFTTIYSAYYVVSVYTVLARHPIGVQSFGWRTDFVYATTLPPAWELVGLIIVLPPVIGALALLRVYPRVEGPERHFRIAMLGGGFALWWVTAVIAGNAATLDIVWLQIANRLIGLLVALGILVAYEPRAWMLRRWAASRQAIS